MNKNTNGKTQEKAGNINKIYNDSHNDYICETVERKNRKDILNKLLNDAISDLYKFDSYLIIHLGISGNETENIHVSERSIVFRYGIYLQDKIKKTVFENYNVDCEYNRNRDSKKTYPGDKGKIHGCYPDFIIHKRGTNDDNLLAIEVKTWWNTDTKHDEDKLRYFTNQTSDYKYEYGLSITLGKDENSVKMKWFQNGIEIT